MREVTLRTGALSMTNVQNLWSNILFQTLRIRKGNCV
jgi:hypothetical protein